MARAAAAVSAVTPGHEVQVMNTVDSTCNRRTVHADWILTGLITLKYHMVWQPLCSDTNNKMVLDARSSQILCCIVTGIVHGVHCCCCWSELLHGHAGDACGRVPDCACGCIHA
jgi:hypothetical protein